MNSDNDNNNDRSLDRSADGTGKSNEYDYTFNGDVDIFSSLYDSNGLDSRDFDSSTSVADGNIREHRSTDDDDDNDNDPFGFESMKRPVRKRNAKKKKEEEEEEEERKKSASGETTIAGRSRSCSSSPTRKSLKRKKSDAAEPDAKRKKTSKEIKEQDVVVIDDDDDAEEDGGAALFGGNKKSKQRKTPKKRATKSRSTRGKGRGKGKNVISVDSDSSDSEISEYEDVGDGDNNDDIYNRNTEDEDDGTNENGIGRRDNGKGEGEDQNNDLNTFKSMQDSLKDIENEDDDFLDDDYGDLLELESSERGSQKSGTGNAKTPIFLNVNMVGNSKPYQFRILRSDPFSKVLNFLSKGTSIPPEKLLLKWGAITLDSNENSNTYALEDYEALDLVVKDDDENENENENDGSRGFVGSHGDTVPLDSLSLPSLASGDIATTTGMDALPQASAEDDGAKVILKLSAPSAGNFSVRISLSKTVQALIAGAAQHYKVPEEKVELQFDGEKMSPGAALSDFGLEDEDQIDVVFRK